MQLTATTNQVRISSFEIHLATLPVFSHIMSCAVELKKIEKIHLAHFSSKR